MSLTAVGITGGVGSMLIGPKLLGYKILGNVEWRSYYHATDEQGRNTFKENFRGAAFVRKLEEPARSLMRGATLAMSHPECGAYSTLSGNQKRLDDKSDIPLALAMIRDLKPRYFAMDELPKALMAMPIEELAEELPGYELFPEWISNYHYGNVQKARNRFFLIGARRNEGFVFVPGEEPSELTIRDVLQGMSDNLPNNDAPATRGVARYARHLRFHGDYPDHTEAASLLRDHPRGTIFYHNAEGRMTPRMSLPKSAWDKPSPVLTGLNPALHPDGRPFNVRERARIQGAPDDFIFYGTKFDEEGKFDHCKNSGMAKQTGKFMPVQFCTYIAAQVKAHVEDRKFRSSGKRIIKPNPYVDAAKLAWCEKFGYKEQKRACTRCWVKCPIRKADPL